jgi:tripartite-type tricarboxylate transporter receptor subunit TctC
VKGRFNVKLPRRNFLHLAMGAATLPAASRIAGAQAYPTRPVRVLEGFGSGSSADLAARLIGHWLSERMRQHFVIENRPGAGSNVATEAVVRAAPDGYTLLTCVTANAINATLYEKLNFNFIRDIAPIAGLLRMPLVMLVNPSLAAKTLPEFIAYAKANPGKVNIAVPGNGSGPHVAGELFKMMAGINIVNVPYRGPAPAFTDLISGQVQAMFVALPAAVGYIRAGELRALAVTSALRSSELPEVSAVAEFVQGYEASGWIGIGAPKGIPAEIIDRLNSNITAGLADPQLKARIKGLGADPMPMAPTQFGALMGDETEKWAKVVKFAGIKAE